MQARLVFTALATALLLIAPFVPATAAQDEADDQAQYKTSPVTFYVHEFNIGNNGPNPGNTQYPIGEDDTSFGIALNCYPDNVAPLIPDAPFDGGETPNCDEFTGNLVYVFSSPGFVDAEAINTCRGGGCDNPYGFFHNERGQTKDILLDTSKNIQASFYMSCDYHPFVFFDAVFPGVPMPWPAWNWDPGFLPSWQVEARLMSINLGEYQGQASEAPSVHPKVVSKEFVTVAEGVSTPRDITCIDDVAGATPQFQTVHEFVIDLGRPKVDRIKKTDDWVMMFKWWSNVGGNRHIIAPPMFWNVNGGEFYPNRWTMPIKNAFDIELVYPRFVYDKLVVLALMNTPWGSYDIDPDTLTFEVTSLRDNQPVEPAAISRVADFSVAHGGHFKPINITWVWDYQADKLRAGEYRVTVSGCNFQHSACSTTSATFSILEGGLPGTTELGRSGAASFTEADLDRQAGSPSTSSGSDDLAVNVPLLAEPMLWASLMGVAFVGRRRLH